MLLYFFIYVYWQISLLRENGALELCIELSNWSNWLTGLPAVQINHSKCPQYWNEENDTIKENKFLKFIWEFCKNSTSSIFTFQTLQIKRLTPSGVSSLVCFSLAQIPETLKLEFFFYSCLLSCTIFDSSHKPNKKLCENICLLKGSFGSTSSQIE